MAPKRSGKVAKRAPKTPRGPPRDARGGAGERAAVTGGFDMQAVMGDYEKDRQGQLARNRAMLAQMGLLSHATTNEMKTPQQKVSASRRRPRTPVPGAPAAGPCRRSSRAVKKHELFGDFAEEGWHRRAGGGASGARRTDFGAVPGVGVGQLWLGRVGCSQDGVHGPWVGGIHGGEAAGAYSVVLSGGYEGDADEGDTFTYTGSGGRGLSGNKRTAPQSSDQQLTGANRALAVNIWRKQPMRVVRGYKLGKLRGSRYAPSAGYRYDGLYAVTDMWPEIGESGFIIWRYRMERLGDQEAAPWEAAGWRAAEEKRLATLRDEQGGAPLIPKGTGTTLAEAGGLKAKKPRPGPSQAEVGEGESAKAKAAKDAARRRPGRRKQ